MNKSWFSPLLLLFAGYGCGQNQAVKILHDVTVVDVRTGTERPHQDVRIEGKKITFVGPSGNNRPIDGNIMHTGGYVIPGLWDMHVHLAGVLADGRWSRDALLPQLLRYGITGVRDMGGDVHVLQQWRSAREAGSLPSPYIAFGGPMLTVSAEASSDSRTVRTAEDARKVVDELAAEHVDFVKILHIPRASYFALAEYTRARGLSFVGHLPYGVSIEEAAEAGQKSIEHVNWSVLALDCSDNPTHFREQLINALQSKEKGGYDRVLDDAAAHFDAAQCAAATEAMRKHGTWLVPTLVAEETASNLGRTAVNSEYLATLPEEIRREWTTEKLEASIPREKRAWLKRQWDADLRLAAFFRQHGVSMLPGSDSLDVENLPGPSLHRELHLLVQIGFSAGEALRSATLDAAEFLGKSDTMGTVEFGKVADLVVLSADPLQDIENTAKIQLVMSQGEVVEGRKVLSSRIPSLKSVEREQTTPATACQP